MIIAEILIWIFEYFLNLYFDPYNHEYVFVLLIITQFEYHCVDKYIHVSVIFFFARYFYTNLMLLKFLSIHNYLFIIG